MAEGGSRGGQSKGKENLPDPMRAYAKQAKNKQLEIDAAEIRIRAERRVGELIAQQRETVGLAKGTKGQLKGRDSSGGSKSDPPEPLPTLADVGIDKHLADRAGSGSILRLVLENRMKESQRPAATRPIAQQRETVGLRGPEHSRGGGSSGSKRDPLPDAPPTLADVGIDKHLADRARKYAAVPEDEWNRELGEWRERVSSEHTRVMTRLQSRGEVELQRTDRPACDIPDSAIGDGRVVCPWRALAARG